MDKLIITSCLAENTHDAGRAVASYLNQRLDLSAEFVADIPWQERERLLDAGGIHLGWICGLLYVWKADQPDPHLELLAAPVMPDPRYQDRPVYYSDIVVGRDSPYNSFADLQGTCWVYNERGSYSGYFVVCHRLAGINKSLNYFDRVLESGAHLKSLEMVVEGRADFTAIDSTVLDFELARRPVLAQHVRVIESIGPSPIPPWVVSRKLPLELRRRLRQLLLNMHLDPVGQAALASGRLSRFVPAIDSNYQSIRDVSLAIRPAAGPA
jgi:phosphonate transport system substrate-binding protein